VPNKVGARERPWRSGTVAPYRYYTRLVNKRDGRGSGARKHPHRPTDPGPPPAHNRTVTGRRPDLYAPLLVWARAARQPPSKSGRPSPPPAPGARKMCLPADSPAQMGSHNGRRGRELTPSSAGARPFSHEVGVLLWAPALLARFPPPVYLSAGFGALEGGTRRLLRPSRRAPHHGGPGPPLSPFPPFPYHPGPAPRPLRWSYSESSHAAATTSRGSAPSALKAATSEPSGLSRTSSSGSSLKL
jgi:hypothetical protein